MANKYLCPDCRHEIEKDWKACPFCGAIFDTDEDESTPSSEDKTEENGETEILFDELFDSDDVDNTVESPAFEVPKEEPPVNVQPPEQPMSSPVHPQEPSVPTEQMQTYTQQTQSVPPVQADTPPVQSNPAPPVQQNITPVQTVSPEPVAPVEKIPAQSVNTPVSQEDTTPPDADPFPEQEKWDYNKSSSVQEEAPEEKKSVMTRMLGAIPSKKEKPKEEERPANAYDPNQDHYYDDIRPAIDDAIMRVPKENILKILGGTALLIVIIVYLIFNLNF